MAVFVTVDEARPQVKKPPRDRDGGGGYGGGGGGYGGGGGGFGGGGGGRHRGGGDRDSRW